MIIFSNLDWVAQHPTMNYWKKEKEKVFIGLKPTLHCIHENLTFSQISDLWVGCFCTHVHWNMERTERREKRLGLFQLREEGFTETDFCSRNNCNGVLGTTRRKKFSWLSPVKTLNCPERLLVKPESSNTCPCKVECIRPHAQIQYEQIHKDILGTKHPHTHTQLVSDFVPPKACPLPRLLLPSAKQSAFLIRKLLNIIVVTPMPPGLPPPPPSAENPVRSLATRRCATTSSDVRTPPGSCPISAHINATGDQVGVADQVHVALFTPQSPPPGPWQPCRRRRSVGFQWWAHSACKQCCACCRGRWPWAPGCRTETERGAVPVSRRLWGGGKGENKSARCYSLLVGDGLVAAVAHANLELEAHEGDGGALGRAFAAHGLAALPAVVLEETGRAYYYYHHRTKQRENETRKMKSCHCADLWLPTMLICHGIKGSVPVWGQFSCCPTSAWSSRRKAAHTSDRSHCPATLGSAQTNIKH